VTPTTSPSTEPPPPDLDLDQFCIDSENFFLPARATAYISPNSPDQIMAVLDEMEATLPAAIESAPTATFAERPLRAAVLLVAIRDFFESSEYNRFLVADNLTEEIQADRDEFDEIVLSLEGFLTESCGFEEAEADALAADFADQLAFTFIQTLIDDSGTITVDVPVEWGDFTTFPFDDSNAIQASGDLESFNTLFNEDGMFIVAQSPTPEGFDIDEVATGQAAAIGCSLIETLDYDDGVYTGRQDVYRQCAGTDAVAVTVVGTDADNTVSFVVAIQLERGFGPAIDIILDSFLVS
jgi:hypothetical protein